VICFVDELMVASTITGAAVAPGRNLAEAHSSSAARSVVFILSGLIFPPDFLKFSWCFGVVSLTR
jgi:hypothetical protein